MHEKNDFAEISKNLAKYRSEHNFARPYKFPLNHINPLNSNNLWETHNKHII